MRLSDLKESDKKGWKIRVESLNGYKKINRVLHYQGLSFIPESIWIKLISQYYDNLLAGYFGINKIKELVGHKYYWLNFRRKVKAYIKGYNVCLALKAMRYKPYSDLQSLPIPSYWEKDLSIDFVTGLPISTDWKGENYNFILVIIYRLTKIIHYKLLKVIINTPSLLIVILVVVRQYYRLLDSIVTNTSLLFTSKFWSLLFYFRDIKRRLSTAICP